MRVVQLVVPCLEKGESRIKDPAARSRHVTGLHRPLRTGIDFHQFLARLRPLLPRVHQRALLVYSRQDPVVAQSNGEYLLAHLGSQSKKLLLLDNSHHILTCDYDKQLVFEAIKMFMESD